MWSASTALPQATPICSTGGTTMSMEEIGRMSPVTLVSCFTTTIQRYRACTTVDGYSVTL